jgi:hypothetical protein
MKRTGGVFIGLLFLLCTGCARRDWTSDLLVFADVTGKWEGTVVLGGVSRTVSWRLRQSGARVTGEAASGLGRRLDGTIEGVVNGDVFTFGIGEASATGALTVSGDEMVGELDFTIGAGTRCPCPIHLRRSGPAAPTGAQMQ